MLGTNGDYFTHLKYGQQQALVLREGRPFETPFEAVLGAQVAEKLGYHLDQSIVIAHGAGNTSFSQHDNMPFKVVGILAPPAPHRSHHPCAAGGHRGDPSGLGHRSSQQERDPGTGDGAGSHPKTITAFMVGLSNRILAFQLQRSVNTYPRGAPDGHPAGSRPAGALGLMSVAETALSVIAGFVVVAGLIGMLTTLLAGLNERRRELAILRSLGAGPAHLFLLLALEAMALTTAGIALGVAALYLGRGLLAPGCSATMACK